jgi:hypothetical protein
VVAESFDEEAMSSNVSVVAGAFCERQQPPPLKPGVRRTGPVSEE